MPAISVLMPVYNAARFLAPAIRSVLEQTFTDFELIIVDDGSTDESPGIIREFAVADPRIVVATQENRGIVAALNRSLQLARAPLLARMDADDVSLPGRFRAQFDALQTDPGLAVLGGHARVIDSDGKPLFASLAPIGRREVDDAVLTHSPLTHPAVMMRRAPIERVGGYRAFYESAEDYDLWLRLLDAGYRIDNLNLVLLQYRQHGAGISGAQRTRQALCTLMARAARGMRHNGLDDTALEHGKVCEASLRVLPPAVRPCEAEILEALYGPAADVPLQRLHANLSAIRQQGPPRCSCRALTAAFLLRSSVGLLRHRHVADALHALRLAQRTDWLAVPRQLGATLRKRRVRARRRARFVRAGRPAA